ncbi:MAG: pseudouridine synthase [Christensenellales bacterium]|jgi:16S rRNA pseudouridine516 synthase
MRIDRYLSLSLGISRKEAAALIRKGAVLMDGAAVVSKDQQVKGKVTANGVEIRYQEHVHLMLNKPAGVLTAARDRSAPTVMELIDPVFVKRGIAPVGRLDKDVTGLLIFTTDGELNHKLTSPSWGIPKVYTAKVNGVLTEGDVAAFETGLELGEFTARPARLEILDDSKARLTVTEGKFHQVKRMFAAVGKPVEILRREMMGEVALDGSLAEGEWRPLLPEEVNALYKAVEGTRQGSDLRTQRG